MTYSLLKVFHIVFVVSWFAGLFYAPRIFVNLAQHEQGPVFDTLLGMAKRLLRFSTLLAVIAIILGLSIMHPWLRNGWLHAKLLLVFLLCCYHFQCYRIYQAFVLHRNRKSHTYYRWFNEIPLLLLVAIVILVILKPF